MKMRPLQNIEARCAAPLPDGANQFGGGSCTRRKSSAFTADFMANYRETPHQISKPPLDGYCARVGHDLIGMPKICTRFSRNLVQYRQNWQIFCMQREFSPSS